MDQAVRGIPTPRPMTHDLIYNLLDAMGARLHRVLVDALLDDTFHGKLVVQTADGREVRVDTRPSDAIVLACKRDIPIFVAEEVLEEVLRHQSNSTDFETESGESEDEEHEGDLPF